MRKKEAPETIYQAALTLFARFGFKKTTMEDVAKALGMTKGNLYRYAANKQALYRDTVSWALTRWQGRVKDAVDRVPDPLGKFEALCYKAVDYLSRDEELHRLLADDPAIFPMFPDPDPFGTINQASVAMIRAILAQGISARAFRPVDTDQVSKVIFMMYKVFIIQTYIKGQAEPVRPMLAETVSLMTRGLCIPQDKLSVDEIA